MKHLAEIKMFVYSFRICNRINQKTSDILFHLFIYCVIYLVERAYRETLKCISIRHFSDSLLCSIKCEWISDCAIFGHLAIRVINCVQLILNYSRAVAIFEWDRAFGNNFGNLFE